MSDAFTFNYDPSLSASFQGQLSSSYTAWLTASLQEAADYIGFLAKEQGLELDAAIAVRSAVEAGDFTLMDLFGAAQSKGAAIADPNDPEPKLVVTIEDGTEVTIDLTAVLTGLDTEVWQTASGGKTKEVTNHVREFYTAIKAPVGYDENWDEANAPPTAEPIEVAVTEQDDEADPGGTDPEVTVDLLDPTKVSDPDGDSLSIVDGSVKLLTEGGAGDLPSYITVSGSTLTIDPNSSELDALRKGETLELVVTYTITDGKGGSVDNTVTITVTGTADKYSGSTNYSTTWLTNDPVSLSVPLEAPEGAFNFSGTAEISVNGDLDRTNESISITFEGGGTFTFAGSTSMGPNLGEANSGQWVTGTGSETFASADGLLDVSYDTSPQVQVGGTINLDITYDYWL